jgi:perosamine synthetase
MEMRNKIIPVYEPWLTEREKEYAFKAIESTWISSNGRYIAEAEKLFAEFIGVDKAIVASSGTTALHLCCRVVGMKAGDVVLSPAATYAATAFAPLYCNAEVKFIDSDPDTWNIDLNAVEQVCKNGKVDYVIPVHLFGNPVDMPSLQSLAKKYGFIIISGEGGAVVSNDDELITTAQMLRGQAQSFEKRYWHVDLGYNYRMTNVQAAILCAQLERHEEILAAKYEVAENYRAILDGDPRITMQKVASGHIHGSWINVISTPMRTPDLAAEMARYGIDTRPMFYPLNEMPPFRDGSVTPVSKRLSEHCIMLPSSPTLGGEDIEYICTSILKILDAST